LGVVGFGGLVTSQPHATNIVCISEAVFVLFFYRTDTSDSQDQLNELFCGIRRAN
jgi:hypothetical protein